MTNGDCVSWAPYCSEFGFCQTSDKYGDIATNIGNIGTAETVDSVIRFSQPVLDTVTSFSMVDTFDTLDAMDSMDTSETADSMDTVDFDSLEIADVFGPFDTQDNVETSDTFDIFDTYDSVPVITLDPRGNLDTHATVVSEEVTLGNKRFDTALDLDTEAVITVDENDLSYDTNETFEFDAVPIFNLDTNDTFDTYDTDPDDTFNKFDAVPVNSLDANDTLDSLDKVTVISSNKSDPSFTLASVDNDAANISEEALDIIGEDAKTLNRADHSKLSELKAAEFVGSGSPQVCNYISTSHHLFYFFISEKDQQ